MIREPIRPVPLDKVVAERLTVFGDKIFLERTRWEDLNGPEQVLVSTIVNGKHAKAAKLASMRGGYSPDRVRDFLLGAEQQHDSSIGLIIGNTYVRQVTRR